MLILAINTASSSTGIALFENSVLGDVFKNNQQNILKTLAEDSWPAKNNEAEKLMPAIADLLKSASEKGKSSISPNCPYSFSDIKQIYVIKGPGSFTGLRVGVTVANTLAYLNNTASYPNTTPGGKCELFGLSTFEYWNCASDLPVLVYAGSGGVYLSEHAHSTRKISTSGNPHSSAEIINLSDINRKLEFKKIKSVTGDISPAQIAILKNTKFLKTKKTFAEIMQAIIEKNLQKPHHVKTSIIKSEKIIQPLYIKEPGITQSKKPTLQKKQL